jgi:VWFA-related protein
MRSNKRMVWTLATIGVLAAFGWQSSIAAPQTPATPAAAPAGNPPAQQNPAPPAAQPPAPPSVNSSNTTVIKAESRVVAVDAVVTDKKGNYVRDLTQPEFKVFEDKQEQPIVNFSNASAGPGADATRYLVLFFDDSTMSAASQMWARKAAAHFIDSTASSRRLMAIVEYGGTIHVSQNFTANTDRLKQVVANINSGSIHPNEPIAPPQLAFGSGAPAGSLGNSESDFAARSMLLALRSLAKNLLSVPGRKTLILFSEGFPLTPDRQSELTATIDACNKANVAIYPMDAAGLQVSPGGLDPSAPLGQPGAPRTQLRIPDRPSLGSSEIIRDTQTADRSTHNSPRGAHLVLAAFSPSPAASPAQHGGGGGGGTGGSGGHGGGAGSPPGGGSGGSGGTGGTGGTGGKGGTGGTGTGGTGTGGTGGSGGAGHGGGGLPTNINYLNNSNQTSAREIIPLIPDTVGGNQQVLFALASGTGGLTIFNTNDLAAGLEKIGRELDQYYILGYTPMHTADGNCHTINVKVVRSGLSVRARSGYCDVKIADALLNQPEGKALEARASSAQPGTIPVSLEAPYFYIAPNVAHVNLTMQIPSSSVNFQKEKKDFHVDVNILGIAYHPDGSVGARFSDVVHVDVAKDSIKDFNKQPFVYMNGFDAAPGKYNLKMVMSTGGESFATAQLPLEIDPYDGKQFGLSSVAMSKDARPLAAISSVVDNELLDERQPLIVKSMQVMPSADNHFKKTDQVSFYTEIYEPLVGSSTPFKVGIKYTIVDAKTNQPALSSGLMLANSFIIPGSPVMPIALFIRSASLPPGDYHLLVQAVDDQNHQSPERSTDFHLE